MCVQLSKVQFIRNLRQSLWLWTVSLQPPATLALHLVWTWCWWKTLDCPCGACRFEPQLLSRLKMLAGFESLVECFLLLFHVHVCFSEFPPDQAIVVVAVLLTLELVSWFSSPSTAELGNCCVPVEWPYRPRGLCGNLPLSLIEISLSWQPVPPAHCCVDNGGCL